MAKRPAVFMKKFHILGGTQENHKAKWRLESKIVVRVLHSAISHILVSCTNPEFLMWCNQHRFKFHQGPRGWGGNVC